MKAALILPLLLALCSAQFNSYNFANNFQGFANNVREGVQRVTSRLRVPPLLTNVKNYRDFVAQTGKNYADAAERTLRERVFNVRQSLVESSNKAFQTGAKSYQSALNAFSDLTQLEFLKQLTGLKKSSQGASKAQISRQLAPITGEKVPESFDWREKGGVTPVKFQGECGSCWSFAATGAIEGHYFRKTGKLPNLSEQNLIDCGSIDFGLNGCDGGFQEYAFAFVTEQEGIAVGKKYPYQDKVERCKYKNNIKGAEIKGFASIPPNNEEAMKEVLAKSGPLACGINGLESLLVYKSGIYNDEECNNGEPNHSILVVGYGSENGNDYWIIKNSWGESWGEEGYFRLPRGKNFCGIATECSYPLL